MNRNCVGLIASLLLFSACGGGNGDSGITGGWTGQLYQAGGLHCSDGNFLGVGSGTATRNISVLIEGGEFIGDSVSLTLEGCTYRATRKSLSEIQFTSDAMQCSKSVTATEITDAGFAIFIDARAARPDESGVPTCVVDENGEMVRE
jgi:hypothetical protein